MKTINNPAEITAILSKQKKEKKKIGFVPTMGALHKGHINLIKTAVKENDICVASVFVNPTQFNNKEDLEKYPRTPQDDINKLQKENVDFLFMPAVEDMYPDDKKMTFDLKGFDKIMEGKFRPGHFDGVADVVYRLFNIIKPDVAYFGEKDYQQLVIIRQMAKSAKMNIDIKGVSTVRENDGLAMSSRNRRLSSEGRKQAKEIYRILRKEVENAIDKDPGKLKSEIKKQVDSFELLKTEYVEIVKEDDFSIMSNWEKNNSYRLCLAVWCEDVRLIDNINIIIK